MDIDYLRIEVAKFTTLNYQEWKFYTNDSYEGQREIFRNSHRLINPNGLGT